MELIVFIGICSIGMVAIAYVCSTLKRTDDKPTQSDGMLGKTTYLIAPEDTESR